MAMTPSELAAIEITPAGLRAVANCPCNGERSFVLRKAADRIEKLEASKEALVTEVKRLQDMVARLSPGWRP